MFRAARLEFRRSLFHDPEYSTPAGNELAPSMRLYFSGEVCFVKFQVVALFLRKIITY